MGGSGWASGPGGRRAIEVTNFEYSLFIDMAFHDMNKQ